MLLINEVVDELDFKVPVGKARSESRRRKSFKVLLGQGVGLVKSVFKGENTVT